MSEEAPGDSKRGRGRPLKFPIARSLEEAFQHVEAGMAPKHPRNEFEREATKAPKGRPPRSSSATQQAAQYAQYLLETGEAKTLHAAACTAATAWGVNADNVRKRVSLNMKGHKYKFSVPVATWPPNLQSGEVEVIERHFAEIVSDEPVVTPPAPAS